MTFRRVMRSYFKKFSEKLFTPVDAASLGMFRILYGALMFWQAYYYLDRDRYIDYFIKPGFHFAYEFFSFVKPLPEKYLLLLLVLMLIAAVGIMVGFFYRFSVLAYLLGFTYLFLLDKAYFNNHYYAIVLLTFLMLLVDAQRWASFDRRRNPHPQVVPYWNVFILQAQVFIIYFYGGIAKLNSDWLMGEPMRGWLAKTDLPWANALIHADWAPYFFSWGGVVFDLSVGILLWFRKTRVLAFVAILFFNLTNSVLFQIGVFPFLMIAAATLFDDYDWPRRMFRLKQGAPASAKLRGEPKRKVVLTFIAIYFGLQILIPLRHWLYGTNVSWSEEGHYFSWHMKLRDKRGRLQIWAEDPATGRRWEVDPRKEINKFQLGKMLGRPQFIHQYVQHLKTQMQEQGIASPVIRVDAWMSLNGRPFQRSIDPRVNLAAAPLSLFKASDWIIPLDPILKPGTIPIDQGPVDEKKAPAEGGGL